MNIQTKFLTKFCQKFATRCLKNQQTVQNIFFNDYLEIRERYKGVHCVDRVKSFPTSIYLQKSSSIQPRTSRLKFSNLLVVRQQTWGLVGCFLWGTYGATATAGYSQILSSFAKFGFPQAVGKGRYVTTTPSGSNEKLWYP